MDSDKEKPTVYMFVEKHFWRKPESDISQSFQKYINIQQLIINHI